MLRDSDNDVAEMAWAGDGVRKSWKQIDRELRELAKRRCALDIEEADLLRVAVRVEVWRELGKASLLEYLEGTRASCTRARRASGGCRGVRAW